MRTSHVLILASAIMLTGIGIGIAQSTLSPSAITGCVVSSTPTYTAGQQVALTCNTSGQLRVTTTP